MDFIAIDFETANNNLNSACALALIGVTDGKIVNSKYYLIQPPTLKFDQINIDIHGITPKDVIDKPKFPEVWKKISKYFTKSNYIIAHNALFDMTVLKICLEEYNLDIPDFNYLCSMAISSRAIKKLSYPVNKYRGLDKLCNLFNIRLNHHNALSDANACAQVVLKTLDITKRKSIDSFLSTYSNVKIYSFKELEIKSRVFIKKRFNHIKISEITTDNKKFNIKHPFYNKLFVFTGNLKSMNRKTAMQNVVDLGGKLRSNVSSKTDYLVVGKQDLSLVGKSGLSTKEIKAKKLIKKNVNIKVLTENEFLKILHNDVVAASTENN